MAKTTDLTVVQASMALDNIIGVLGRVRHRITDGDLQGAQGVLVVVMDVDGFVAVDKSEALTESEAMNLASVTTHAMCMKFMRDDGDFGDAG